MSQPLLGPPSHSHSFNNAHWTTYNSVGGGYSAGAMGEVALGEKHGLKIVNHSEDYGQDGYEEDYDWEIIHHPNCEKKLVSRESMKRMKFPIVPDPARHLSNPTDRYSRYEPEFLSDTVTCYECSMAQLIHRNGLGYLSVEWTTLEEGMYEIILVQTKEQMKMGSGLHPRIKLL
jgi:hypothetical protein